MRHWGRYAFDFCSSFSLRDFRHAMVNYSFGTGKLPNHVDNYFSDIASIHKYQTRLASWQNIIQGRRDSGRAGGQ